MEAFLVPATPARSKIARSRTHWKEAKMTYAMTPARPRRPKEETARLGDEIYERDIKARVEADHHGEFVSIDVDSGAWAISDDLLTAAKRLREQSPDAIDVWSVRVGHRALHHFGGRPLRSPE